MECCKQNVQIVKKKKFKLLQINFNLKNKPQIKKKNLNSRRINWNSKTYKFWLQTKWPSNWKKKIQIFKSINLNFDCKRNVPQIGKRKIQIIKKKNENFLLQHNSNGFRNRRNVKVWNWRHPIDWQDLSREICWKAKAKAKKVTKKICLLDSKVWFFFFSEMRKTIST